mmetsp:Transcript_12214/g.17534  ORF Transcript_12214/g.17534 Transcript_12214/m.17534 type:complete len:98 (+) Transcript_12214:91-384(+)
MPKYVNKSAKLADTTFHRASTSLDNAEERSSPQHVGTIRPTIDSLLTRRHQRRRMAAAAVVVGAIIIIVGEAERIECLPEWAECADGEEEVGFAKEA